jgi:hypothetical protein
LIASRIRSLTVICTAPSIETRSDTPDLSCSHEYVFGFVVAIWCHSSCVFTPSSSDIDSELLRQELESSLNAANTGLGGNTADVNNKIAAQISSITAVKHS